MSDEDLFADDEMELPTMRGNTNLDVQDYQGSSLDTDFLTDDLQEELPKRGGGPAPATDVEGTDSFEMMDDVDNAPGMNQTTYGQNPWQTASSTGYRPYSQQSTDMSDLGDADGGSTALAPRYATPDSIARQAPFRPSQENEMPSHEGIDPLTEYDRSSYEYSDSEQNVIGSGIFDVEEGVTFRARDGIFANQFAEPAYIAEEDPDGLQQSAMWDSTADNWTVTQVNASGVPLSKRVPALAPPPKAFSPFMGGSAQGRRTPMPKMQADRMGPASHIEAFGRRAAQCLIAEAKMMPNQGVRSQFLASATDALGPQMARKAKVVADRLVQMGYKPDAALQDTLAHCVMHATMRDLSDRAKAGGGLPRLDRMAAAVRANQPALKKAAADHLGPLVADQKKLQSDLGAFYHSSAAAGMGEVAQTAPDALVPAAPSTQMPTGFLTPRNLVIGAAVIGVGYLAATQTEAGQKMTSNVRGSWRRMMRKMKRNSRRSSRRGKRN